MAVSESPLPVLHAVPGVRIGVVEAAVRKPGRNDLVLMALAEGSRVAGVFTRNLFRAAPVRFAESHLRDDDPRYLLINTGNANAGTGRAGNRAVEQNCAALADLAGCRPTQIIPYSTGVIGELLPAGRIDAALPEALDGLEADHWASAADAIRTTDIRPKGRSLRLELSGGTITLTGIAKGSGMIRPDMATMLAYIATDAAIDTASLRHLLRDAVAVSFNRITVDGDTSTNDACTLIATAVSDVTLADASDRDRFLDALTTMCTALAREVVADGEGATRDAAIRVTGAQTTAEAERVAFAVAESPLVKTALFAADPNWGRILAAVGRAGVRDLDVDRVRIDIGDCPVVEGGGLSPDYEESAAAAQMAADHVSITIDLDRGGETATVWTCDFSYDYVRINAEYRS